MANIVLQSNIESTNLYSPPLEYPYVYSSNWYLLPELMTDDIQSFRSCK